MYIEKYRCISQPVVEEYFQNLTYLRRVDGERDAIERMEHLAQVRDLADKARAKGTRSMPERIAFTAHNVEAAKQAAMAWLSLTRMLPVEGEAQSKSSEETERIVALFTQMLVPEESGEAPEEEEQPDLERDVLLVDHGQLFPDATPTGEPVKISENLAKAMSAANNLMIDCFNKALDDKLADRLKRIDTPVLYLAVPDGIATEHFLRRVSFEMGFHVVQVQEASSEHCQRVLMEYAQALGRPLVSSARPGELVDRLRRYRGNLFSEQDLAKFVDRAVEQGSGGLKEESFLLYGEMDGLAGAKKLKEMIGLQDVKRNMFAMYALRRAQRETGLEGGMLHRNLAFAGRPGTGKSQVARLFHEILTGAGLSNGRFVTARRQDLIGQYVGHTAPKIHQLFQDAAGGVLFIDEAGYLLQDDVFTHEAVVELVRYMEEQPETTVIFATYPEQMKEVLALDPGFSSRVRRVIRFPDYTDGELKKILAQMVEKSGYRLSSAAAGAASACLTALRRHKGESFANAREARRLTESAIEHYALRLYGEDAPGGKKPRNPSGAHILTREDILAASRDLLPPEPETKRVIGFQVV